MGRGFEAFGVTHSQRVPTMFVRMFKLPAAVRRRHDVSTVRAATHAAAPCPIDVAAMMDWWGPVLLIAGYRARRAQTDAGVRAG